MAHRLVKIASSCALAAQLLSACGSSGVPAPVFPGSPTIDEAGVRSDLEGWRRGIEAVHPALPARTDMDGFDATLESIAREIDGPMTQPEVWRLFSRLNPPLNDGHAGVTLPNQGEMAGAHLEGGGFIFPFDVHIDERQRLFIANAGAQWRSVATGDEVLSINRIPAAEIVSEMLARAHGDTPRFRRELVSRRFPMMFLWLYGDTARYRIEIGRSNNGGKVIVAQGAKRLPVALQPGHPEGYYFDYRVLDGRIGYLKAGSFGHEHADFFLNFAREAFTRFHQADIQALIIDIRDNDGGDDPLWQEGLMEYITRKPYRHVSRYSVRITEENADPGEQIGEVRSKEYTRLFLPKEDNPVRFDGPTYILIGPYTYSAAIQFAVAAQDYGIAKIAGEETGGFSCQTGRTTTIPMPRTGLNAFAPRLAMTRPAGVGCDRGVIPDIAAPTDPFRRDDAVEALREYAARRV